MQTLDKYSFLFGKWSVHCRIGSLENEQYPHHRCASVHCRIGSLEMGEDEVNQTTCRNTD